MIHRAIIDFYSRSREPNHRFKSWEHCYRFFSNRPTSDKDTACLHLAFYLASWGMLRGSAKLLQKDYRIHAEAVSIILDSKFDCLFALSLIDAQKKEDTLFELIGTLRNVYRRLLGNGSSPSDTLITKVLLGTLGCVPAYDIFFVKGLRMEGVSYSGLKVSNFREMIQYCKDFEELLFQSQEDINKIAESEGVQYPIMKIIDMWFWTRGQYT